MTYQSKVTELLESFKSGQLSLAEVEKSIAQAGIRDLGFASIDDARSLRQGFPEVVYCAGKTNEQSKKIIEHLAAINSNLLATRANKELFEFVRQTIPEARYVKIARLIFVERAPLPRDAKRKIAIITAGTSDMPVAEEAAITAEIMGNTVNRIYDVGVAGLHRLFARMDDINEANVLVVIAGMEGALASVVGGLVNKPILAVPTSVGYGANFAGLSALLGMLNSCSAGVAVMNIDNGFGAGRMASMINHMR